MNAAAKGLLAAILLLAAPLSWAADPVAFVSDLKGEVILDGVARPAFLAELLPGSRLALGDGATAAVMYVVSGHEFAMKGPGEYTVAKESVTVLKGAPAIQRTPALRPGLPVVVRTSKAATASLRMRNVAPARPPAAGPIYPLSGRISMLQPTLRWAGEADRTYEIVVTASSGKEAYRGQVKGTTLRLPVKLVPGQSYSWACAHPDGARGEARFETLTVDGLQAADKARAGAKSFRDRALLALALDELGAGPDAREVWAQLAAERPDLPEIAGLSR